MVAYTKVVADGKRMGGLMICSYNSIVGDL